MDINICVEDYLSREEIKEICVQHVRETLSQGRERILTNMAYHAAYGIIDSAVTPEELEVIKSKTKEVVSKIDTYHVFRLKDMWGEPASLAQQILDQAVLENKPLIQEKVLEAIAAYDVDSIYEDRDVISEALIEALRKGFSKE